jgi:hypothetical protein
MINFRASIKFAIMMYKNRQAVNEIITIDKILFFDVGFLNFFKDFKNPKIEITKAIKDKQPIKVEII